MNHNYGSVLSMDYYISTNYLPPNPIVIDAGANNGLDSFKMSQLWPQGTIYSFEPNPKIYNILIQNTKLIKNIKCFNMALGDCVGCQEFHISNDLNSYASSLASPSDEATKNFSTSISVPVTTLDAWAMAHHVSKVDFMWLDMQGSEGAMLLASPEILKTTKVIKLEFYTFHQYKGIMLLDEVTSFLTSKGFKILYHEPETNGDIIFVRR